MKILSLAFFICCYFSSQAQELHLVWNKFIGGATNCNALTNYAIATADKGILFVGRSNCNGSGDIPATTAMQWGDNVMVGKVDSNANIEWIKIFGGTGADEAFSACQTADGGYVVLTQTQSPDGDVVGFKGSRDLWVLRLNSQGNMLWNKCFGSASSSDQALSVATTPENGLLILGASNGSGDDIPFHYGDGFTFDWLLIKTDSAGNKIWSKTLGGTSSESASYGSSVFAANDGYFLVGSSRSTDHDCNDTSWHGTANTNYDAYILHLDTSGTVLWSKSYGGTQNDKAFNAIWDDRDSTIAMITYTTSSDYMVNSNGAERAWVVKVSKDGNLLWETAAGVTGASVEALPMSITKAQGNGYLATSIIFSVIGNRDIFLMACDSSGNAITKVVGSTGLEWNGSIIAYRQGYAALGLSASQGFTEGVNSGGYGIAANTFISYISYFPTNIVEVRPVGEIKVLPNPAQEKVRIIFPASNKVNRLVISDSNGSKVFEERVRRRDYVEITTQAWIKGTYIVRLECEGGEVLATKFVVN